MKKNLELLETTSIERRTLLNALAKKSQNSAVKKVYVVDDSLNSLQLMKSYLSSFNDVEISLFESEIEALRSISQMEPDLIIIDLHLSLIDGLRLSEIIKDITPLSIPVIFMSADPGYRQILKRKQIESAFLSKPLIRMDVLKTVEKIIVSGLALKCA